MKSASRVCRHHSDFIEVDISNLHTGQALHVSDIIPTANVTIMTPGEEAVAVVAKGIKAEDLELKLEGEEPAEEAAEGASEE